MIAAVERKDGVGQNKEKTERDEGRDDEGLFAGSVSPIQSLQDAARNAA